MTLPASKLSVTIITRDEEAQIGDCLESVRWADEIIVVDTGSADRTLEICAKYTPHVYSRPWEGYAPAKNAAIALATGDWILSLDADEQVSAGLRREIAALQQQPLDTRANGYAVPRRNYLWGHWLRYGGLYPDYQIRLFKRGKGAFTAHGGCTNRWRSMGQLSACGIPSNTTVIRGSAMSSNASIATLSWPRLTYGTKVSRFAGPHW